MANDYIIVGGELYHHGVKGMKWGVRRYQNKDGSLTEKGIKRYARKGYAKDAYDANQTTGGKVWDKYTGAHKIRGDVRYERSSKKANQERAEQYIADKQKPKAKKPKKDKVERDNSTVKEILKTKQVSDGDRYAAQMMRTRNAAVGAVAGRAVGAVASTAMGRTTFISNKGKSYDVNRGIVNVAGAAGGVIGAKRGSAKAAEYLKDKYGV